MATPDELLSVLKPDDVGLVARDSSRDLLSAFRKSDGRPGCSLEFKDGRWQFAAGHSAYHDGGKIIVDVRAAVAQANVLYPNGPQDVTW